MIYLDYAAATPLEKKVLEKMLPFLDRDFANPSSIYQFAQNSRGAVDKARGEVAKILHCAADEVFFTGSGTEANNWAVFGVSNATSKKHIITTQIEHHSILHPINELQRRGYDVTFLKVDKQGRINLQELEKAITPETFLVSVMYGQNEIGTLENIEEIGKITNKHGVVFHTDACQAAGFENLNVEDLKVDMMTLNGGKIYGPKGVGCLFIKKGTKITPLLYGGGQEHRLRGGTENVAGIVGFAEALKLAEAHKDKEKNRIKGLKDELIASISKIPHAHLNGDPDHRLANNVNFSFEGVDGESLLFRLDLEGICASTGSACTAGTLEPSHVLLGIGLPTKLAKGSLRLTLGKHTTKEEIQTVLQKLPKIIADLRDTKGDFSIQT